MKKLLALLLALAMLFSLAAIFAGCEDSGKKKKSSSSSRDEDDEDDEDEADDETTEPEETVPEGNQIGDRCFSFELDIVDGSGATGETVDPSKTGKVTVINFWGTWCGPCVGELPHFDEAARNYDISVIAIHSKESKKDMPEYISTHYPDSPIVFAWDKEGSDPYADEFYMMMGNVQAYPYTVVLDANGIITFTQIGSMTYEELEAAIVSAGAIKNKSASLTGDFELQIFTGGYGTEAWDYAITEFQKLNPELNIVLHMDPSVNSQMKRRWENNNPPDFVFLEGTNIPIETWIGEGKLRDLTELYENGTVYGTNTLIKDQLLDGLVSPYGDTGNIYQMPILLSSYGIWYDEALMEENGWEVPTNYSELLSFCQKVSSPNMSPLVYTGQYSGYGIWGLMMPAVAAAAAESGDLQYFYDVCSAVDASVWSDPRFKGALQKIKELADAGYFHKKSPSVDHINSQMWWLNHEAVLIPNGFWLEKEMRDKIPVGFKMRYYPSVTHDENQTPCIIVSAVTMGIAENAKNPEAAEAFIRFLYTDEIARVFAEQCGAPIVTKTDLTSANLTDTSKQVNAMLGSDSVQLVVKAHTSWGSLETTLCSCFNKLVSGEYTVEQVIEELENATNKQTDNSNFETMIDVDDAGF